MIGWCMRCVSPLCAFVGHEFGFSDVKRVVAGCNRTAADFSIYTDDPELYRNQPVCIQVVGRPFQDEEVVANMEAIDLVVNT